MIKIEKPTISCADDNHSRLSCDIWVDDELRTVWFEVEKEYEQYLCTERSDAFVLGLLSWAMRLNHDIECVAPITDELLYNIRTYVIPLLTKYGKTLYPINIKADIAPALKNDGAVGTGCSCGVDSFHSILNNYNSEFPNAKLTHLFVHYHSLFGQVETAKKIADALGLKLVIAKSNFIDVFIQDSLRANTYVAMCMVFCLQKLWKTYFYASCHDFGHFKLKDNEDYDSSHTDLLILNSFSHSHLRLYSEGGAITRLEKTQFIADNNLAQNFLHVCIRSSVHNCGKCFKCVRTMNSLYSIGKLDKFSKVFDVDFYKKHKYFYLVRLYKCHLEKDDLSDSEYKLLKKEIPLYVKIVALFLYFNDVQKHFSRKIRQSAGVYKQLFS